jgi:hypothetical protein
MTKRARSADGKIHEFPDNTPDTVIDRVMRDYARTNPRQAPLAENGLVNLIRGNRAPPRRGQRRPASTEATQFLNELSSAIPFASELYVNLDVGRQAVDEAVQGRGVYGFLKNGRMGQPFSTKEEKEKRARDYQAALSQDLNARRPNAAAFTRGTGNALPLLIPGTQGQALPMAGRLVNVARGAAGSAASGAANRLVTGQGTPQERLARASDLKSIALDATLGGAAGNFVPRAPSARSRVSPEVRTLVREGVQVTPGQALGGTAKKLEDMATSAPIMGTAVTAARERGVASLNRAAAQRALRPIGQKLPEDVATGNEAIAATAEQFSRRYEDIVPQGGMSARDPELMQGFAKIQNITADMTDSSRNQLASIIRERVTNRIAKDGRITGEAFKKIEADLTQKSGQFTKSQDPNEQDIGRALQDVLGGLRESLARQNPAYAKALADTNKGYSRLATLESAASRPGNVGGISTPKQLREAFRMGDKSVRRRATAQGRRPDQPFYDAAAAVLPSNIADSGTAGRMMNSPLALGGLGALTVSNPAIGVPAVSALSLGAGAYSKPAMDLFNRALAKNVSRRDAELALEKLGLLAAQNPKLRALYEQAAIRIGYGSQMPSQSTETVGR